jgi:hypothetical protein
MVSLSKGQSFPQGASGVSLESLWGSLFLCDRSTSNRTRNLLNPIWGCPSFCTSSSHFCSVVLEGVIYPNLVGHKPSLRSGEGLEVRIRLEGFGLLET